MAAESIGLTAFLVKSDKVSELEIRFPPTSPFAIPLAPPLDGYFTPIPPAGGVPPWVGAVGTLLTNPIPPPMLAQTPGGVLVIRRGAQTFAVTFGHAWQKLEDEWLEPDFGRRVALNSIAKDGLVEIRVEQVFAKWHTASDRAPKAASVEEFGVEFDRDLVAAIEGIPADPKQLGKFVRGSTSLRLRLPITSLPTMLDRAAKQFSSTEYRKHWPEIDNLTPVRDSGLILQLESALDAELGSVSGRKKLVLFTPTHRRDDAITVDSYVFGRLSKTPVTRPYLTVDAWLDHLALTNDTPSVASAKSTRVHLLDGADEEIKACSTFDCMGFELNIGAQTYVLSSAIWYTVVPEFIKRTNAAIAKIGPPSKLLPPWNQVQSEGEYNAECAKDTAFLTFDQQMIWFGGAQSKFEFCDVLHPASRTMYFAKIVSRSSGMSHLVEQVRRTSELCFSADPSFRQRLAKVFKEHHPGADTSWLNGRPRPHDWNLCLVSLGRTAGTLPFFAKCALVKLTKQLSERGHQVSFLKV